MERQRVIILGAAGRDFHDFNMVYRDDPYYEVLAFTATQIPFIEKRIYPPELAGKNYPHGIPIYPEKELQGLITKHKVDQVVFAYSDVSHDYVMHMASMCLSLGADFILLGPKKTMLTSTKPLISVCAVRTGAGKSGITRYVVHLLRDKGVEPVVIRHPMPYHDLLKSRSQRFEKMDDLDRHDCTIEEREEIESLIKSGVVVFSGVDYQEILKAAEAEADLIIWDGGNNDLPFVRPDLEIVVLDPHRPGHEVSYHPGEANLRRAAIAVINKTDTADRDDVAVVEENVKRVNPEAEIIHTASTISLETPCDIKGKKVLVVEDGPTLTHGGMPYGAGVIAARKFGAGQLVDPRPYAKGSIKETFKEYVQIGSLLPAMGYSPEQIEELKATIEETPCDIVLIATPIDLGSLLELEKDAVRVNYEIEETGGSRLKERIEGFIVENAGA
jgi:predicted GTPase